jgi:hypothetical protein
MNSRMKNLVFGDVSEGHGHEEMHGRVLHRVEHPPHTLAAEPSRSSPTECAILILTWEGGAL